MLFTAKSQRRMQSIRTDTISDDLPFNQDEIPKGYYFLELFMGSGRLSKSFKRRLESAGRQGVQVIGFDLLQGRSGDLLNHETFQHVMALINSGRCLGVWMAPPCSTWSPSRRNDEHKGAPPLRSHDHIMGLPGLDNHQRIPQLQRSLRGTSQAARRSSCFTETIPANSKRPRRISVGCMTRRPTTDR